MVKKNNDNILWVILVIVLIIIVVPKLPFVGKGAFSVVTTQVCSDGVLNYYSLDGSLLDSKGNLNLINHDTKFISGKLGSGALEFNTTSSVSFPSIPSGNIFMWIKNYSNVGSDWYYASYVNGTNVDATKPIIMPSSNFGYGFNGSVDEIVVTNTATGFSNIQACYQTIQQVNVSCPDYYSTQNLVNSTGSLNVNGTFFPECSYTWQPAQYSISNNLCSKNLIYHPSCLTNLNCYPTSQSCTENLKYSCFVLSNNFCTEKTDYFSCVSGITNNTYSTSSECNSKVVATTLPNTNSVVNQPTTKETTSISNLATKEIWNIAGFSVTPITLGVLLILIIGGFYLISSKK